MTNQATQSNAYYVELDDGGWAATRKQTVGTLLSGEATARAAADTATQTGAGIAGGTYTPDATSEYLTAADFAGAGLTASLFNADVLLDAALKDMADMIDGYSSLQATVIKISASRAGNLLTYPAEMIATPGTNKMTCVLSAAAFLDYTAPAWDADTDTLDLGYESGNIGTFTEAFCESVADAYEVMTFNSTLTAYSNEAIMLSSASDWGSRAAGNSDIYIWILYYTIDFSQYNVEI